MAEIAHEVVATGLQFPEGPVALADGSVLLVEIRRGTLSCVSPDGTVSTVAELGGGPNGAAIGPDGAAYVCNNGGFNWLDLGGMFVPHHRAADYVSGSIQRVDLATGAATTLYDSCDGVPLSGPNDIVFDADGGFWFTDHGQTTERQRDQGGIFYARTDGSRIVQARTGMISPNGIGLSPDGKTLFVSDTQTSRLWAIDILGPGVLADPPPFLHGTLVASLPGVQPLDSLAVEADGRVCVATMLNGGITVFSADGSTEHVALPDIGITNICFGGPDMRDAWVTGATTGQLFRMRWPRPGLKLAFNA